MKVKVRIGEGEELTTCDSGFTFYTKLPCPECGATESEDCKGAELDVPEVKTVQGDVVGVKG